MSIFCNNINEYVSVGDSIMAIINKDSRCLCKILHITDNSNIECIKYKLRSSITQPISNNIYEIYTSELTDVNTNTNNKLYNIKEVVIAKYDIINISVNYILDTVIVATPDQLLNDNGILYSIGISSIFLIQFQQEHPNLPLVSYASNCQLYDNSIMSGRSIKRSSTLLWYNTMYRIRKSIQTELNKRHDGREFISTKKIHLSGPDFKRLYNLVCNIYGNEIIILRNIMEDIDNDIGISVIHKMHNNVIKYFTGFSFINMRYRHEITSFDIPYNILLELLGYEALIGFPESNLYRWSSITTEIMNHTMNRMKGNSFITCNYCYALETVHFKFNIERFYSCSQGVINEIRVLRPNNFYMQWFE